MPTGPVPPQKFQTELDRATALLHEVFLFHHTSALSRSHPSSLRKMRLLPPLLYSAFVEVALALGVECIWAEAEADDVVAFVASARGGFVVGLDSDFVIYGGRPDGAEERVHERGYIPINSMRWESHAATADDDADEILRSDQVDDDGFQIVQPKRKARADVYRPSSPVPPFVPHPDFLVSMTCTVFTPDLLAASLQLPVRLLPLFASLVGNDYCNFGTRLQHRGSNAVERVERVARCLRESREPRKGVKAPDGLTELLARTVDALLVQGLSEIDKEEMIHTLIDSALLYTLPSSLPPVLTTSKHYTSSHREAAEPLYAAAVVRGELAPRLSGVIRDGRYIVRPWLEDTTRRSVGRVAGDGVRAAWTAVLADALGVGYVEPNVDQVGNVESDDDVREETGSLDPLDELVSDEEDDWAGTRTEAAAPAQACSAGEDHADQAEKVVPPMNVAGSSPTALMGEPHLLVYHRSSTALHPSLHPIPTLTSLLEAASSGSGLLPDLEGLTGQESVVSQPLAWRVQLHLALLGSLTPAVDQIPDGQKPLVLGLRWMICALAQEGERAVKSRLRRAEVDAIVIGGLRAARAWSAWLSTANEAGAGGAAVPVPPFDRSVPIQEISNRSVHVTSHLLHTLHETDLLRQALLIPSAALPRAHIFYDGKMLHALLTEAESVGVGRPPTFQSTEEQIDLKRCVAAVLDGGLETFLTAEPELETKGTRNQRKKEAKKARKAQEAAAVGSAPTSGAKRGFELLGEVDA